MGLSDVLNKLREMKERRLAEINLPEGETNDMHLKSLRRERQKQQEEQEKLRLKKQIAHYKKNQMRKQLYGVVRDVKKKKMKQNKNILKDNFKIL